MATDSATGRHLVRWTGLALARAAAPFGWAVFIADRPRLSDEAPGASVARPARIERSILLTKLLPALPAVLGPVQQEAVRVLDAGGGAAVDRELIDAMDVQRRAVTISRVSVVGSY